MGTIKHQYETQKQKVDSLRDKSMNLLNQYRESDYQNHEVYEKRRLFNSMILRPESNKLSVLKKMADLAEELEVAENKVETYKEAYLLKTNG